MGGWVDGRIDGRHSNQNSAVSFSEGVGGLGQLQAERVAEEVGVKVS